MNPKVKTALCAATFLILTSGGLVRMTGLPKPGLTGQPAPAEPSIEQRFMADRLQLDVILQCEDFGRRTSRFSAQDGAFREWMEYEIRSAGLDFSVQEYEIDHQRFYNLIGTRQGDGDGIVFVGTHYDSYGKSQCANASATGVATVLETMRSLRDRSIRKTLVFGLFATGEEPHRGRDTMGAKVWLDHVIADGMEIDAALLVGSFGAYRYGEGTQNSSFPWYLLYPSTGDWTGVYGSFTGKDAARKALEHWAVVTDLPARGFAAPTWMLGIPSADQVPFQDAGIPAVLFSDTGPERDAHLRSASDIPYTISFPEMARRVEAFVDVVERFGND